MTLLAPMLPFSNFHVSIAMAMLGLLTVAGVRVTMSLYALSLHMSAFQIGSLIAMFGLFPMLFAVRAGRWLDRVGSATPLLAGSMLIFSGALTATLQRQSWLLYPAAACAGTGFTLVLMAAQNLVGQLGPDESRTNRLTTMTLLMSVATIAAPVLAGLIIDHFSHRSAFTLFAATALVLLLLVLWLAKHLPTLITPASQSDAPRSALALFWHAPRLRLVYIVNILLAAAWDLFMFSTPIQGSAKHFSASTIGLILGSFSFATFVIRFAMPMLSRHFGHWQIILAALGVTACGFLLYPFLQQAGGVMLLAFVLGLALGASQPNLLSLLFESAPEGRMGEVLGIRLTIGNGAQALLPMLFGAVGAKLGWVPVFVLLSALLAGGVALVWKDGIHAAPHA